MKMYQNALHVIIMNICVCMQMSHTPARRCHVHLRTVVSQVGGRTFWVKILKCFFLVALAPLGLERSGKTDFTAPEPQEAEKMLHQFGSYVNFTV